MGISQLSTAVAHQLGLLAGRRPAVVGGLATAGIVLFSGSCYAVAFAEDKGYGRLAPYGCAHTSCGAAQGGCVSAYVHMQT